MCTSFSSSASRRSHLTNMGLTHMLFRPVCAIRQALAEIRFTSSSDVSDLTRLGSKCYWMSLQSTGEEIILVRLYRCGGSITARITAWNLITAISQTHCCGNIDTAHRARFVDNGSLRYWVHEIHVDGFRFDSLRCWRASYSR